TLEQEQQKHVFIAEQVLENKEKLKALKVQMQQHEHAKFDMINLAKQKEETLRQGKLVSKLIELYRQFSETKLLEAQVVKQFQTAHASYSELEQLWINAQAAILASHLHNGEACPVCGSVEHPEKAILTQQPPQKEELDKMKQKLDQLQQHVLELQANLKTFTGQLQ